MDMTQIINEKNKPLLSSRLYQLCKRNNINTVEDLSKLTFTQLYVERNVGHKTIKYIKEILAEHGLQLSES